MSRELLQEALDTLIVHQNQTRPLQITNDCIKKLQDALAQFEKTPVCSKDPYFCWSVCCQLVKVCKNTAPQQKKWVGLTENELKEIWDNGGWYVRMFENVQLKLKEKNT